MTNASPDHGRDLPIAVILFLAALAAYHVNGDFYHMEDATPSALLAESVLNEGNLSLTPDEIADAMIWTLHGGGGSTEVSITHVDNHVRDLQTTGHLRVNEENYCYRCVPSVHEGLYTSAFSPGAGLTALPLFALARPWLGPLGDEPLYLWWGGKIVASLCVAGSVVLIYFSLRVFLDQKYSALISVAYALGTCVWVISSQALWQHGPNELYLALGTFALVRTDRGWRYAVLCGFALGAATWCRPTGALIVLPVAGYLLLRNRTALMAFILAGLPLAVAMAAYNQYYFGSPWAFGQTQLSQLAIDKTGSPEIWQTPLWVGLPGILISPSRGLFVYSPFLLFAMWGMWRTWRDRRFEILRPLSVGILAIWVIESLHFDWWSGWSYGYRHIVDTVPLLVLFLVPVVGTVFTGRLLRAVFMVSLAWSIGVQMLGAFAFNLRGWNARFAYVAHHDSESTIFFDEDRALSYYRHGVHVAPVEMNVDNVDYRHRLWSITETQIGYYLTHFAEARRQKHELARKHARSRTVRRGETHRVLGAGWLMVGEPDRAEEHYRLALEILPDDVEAMLGIGKAVAARGKLAEAEAWFRRALKLEPENVHSLNLLGFALVGRNQLSDGLQAFLQALDIRFLAAEAAYDSTQHLWQTWLRPNQPDATLPEPYATANAMRVDLCEGRLALAAFELEPATDHLRAAVKTAPDVALAHQLLGAALLEQQRWDEAVVSLRRALELDPSLAEAHDRLGVALIHLEQHEAARDHFAHAARLDPSQPRYQRHLRGASKRLEGRTGARPMTSSAPPA